MDVDVETLGTKELAYYITVLEWDLFWAIHEYELLYHTFGRHHFGKVREEGVVEFILRISAHHQSTSTNNPLF